MKSLYKFASEEGDLCDPVENASIAEAHVGTISKTDISGPLQKPIPAILARFDYVCGNRTAATKERETGDWTILALDKEFEMIRCLRTSNSEIVHNIARQCGFSEAVSAPEQIAASPVRADGPPLTTLPAPPTQDVASPPRDADITNTPGISPEFLAAAKESAANAPACKTPTRDPKLGAPVKLGVAMVSVTPAIASMLQRPHLAGVVITYVKAQSVAATTGLRVADVISQIGDKPVSSDCDAIGTVAATAANATLPLRVWRPDGEVTLEARF